MREKSYKQYNDFSGGSCEGMAPNRIPDATVARSKNLLVKPGGFLASRQGFIAGEVFSDFTTDHNNIIKNMGYWPKEDGSISLLAFTNTETLVSENPWSYGHYPAAKGYFSYRDKLYFSDGTDLKYIDKGGIVHATKAANYRGWNLTAIASYPTSFPNSPNPAVYAPTTLLDRPTDKPLFSMTFETGGYNPFFVKGATYKAFVTFEMSNGKHTDKCGFQQLVAPDSVGIMTFAISQLPVTYSFERMHCWMSLPNSDEFHEVWVIHRDDMAIKNSTTRYKSHQTNYGTRNDMLANYPVIYSPPTPTGAISAGTYEIGVAVINANVESSMLIVAEITVTQGATLSISAIVGALGGAPDIAAPESVAFYRRLKSAGGNFYKVNSVAGGGGNLSQSGRTYTVSDNVEILTNMPYHTDPNTTAYSIISNCNYFVTSSRTMRAYAAGDPAYPYRVYYSRINNPSLWDNNAFLEPSTADGPITGLAVFSDCVLVIFRNTIWALKGLDPDTGGDAQWFKVPVAVGTNQPRTIVQTPSSLTFLASNGNLYSIGPNLLDINLTMAAGDDLVPEIAGPRMKEFFSKAVTKDDSCFATFNPRTNEFIVAAFDDDLHDYDSTARRFVVMDWSTKAFCPCEVKDAIPTAMVTLPNGRTHVALHGVGGQTGGNFSREWRCAGEPTYDGDTEREIVYYDHGASTTESIPKRDLEWFVESKQYDLDSPSVYKHLMRLVVEFTGKNDFTVAITAHDGQATVLQEQVIPSSNFTDGTLQRAEIPMHLFGTNFSVRIEGVTSPSDINAPFELHGLTFVFRTKKIKPSREDGAWTSYSPVDSGGIL